MKIFDYGKAYGYPQQTSDPKRLKIIWNIRLKKISGGEKLLLIKNKDNPFYFPKSNKKTNNTSNNQSQKNGIKFIAFNNKNKIKNLGYNGNDITEINSCDPRLLFVWYYNPLIIITLHYNEKKVEIFQYEDFHQKFPNFDISNKNHWTKFIALFKTKKNENIKGLGKMNFIKLLENWKTIDKEIKKWIELNDFQKRQKNVEHLIKEIA